MIIELDINGARVIVSGENLSVSVCEVTEQVKEPVAKAFEAFPHPKHILTLADLYCLASGIAPTTLSTWIFNDGKRIQRLRAGLGLTIQTYNDALIWFASHWHNLPNAMGWPTDVPRPTNGASA